MKLFRLFYLQRPSTRLKELNASMVQGYKLGWLQGRIDLMNRQILRTLPQDTAEQAERMIREILEG